MERQPRMLEPSKPYPSWKLDSLNSWMGTEKCCQRPGKSMNLMSRICAPFSFAILRTSAGFICFFPPLKARILAQLGSLSKTSRHFPRLDGRVEFVYDGSRSPTLHARGRHGDSSANSTPITARAWLAPACRHRRWRRAAACVAAQEDGGSCGE